MWIFSAIFPLGSGILKIRGWQAVQGQKGHFFLQIFRFSGNADIRHLQAWQAMALCCFSMTECGRIDLQLFMNGRIKINSGFFIRSRGRWGKCGWHTEEPEKRLIFSLICRGVHVKRFGIFCSRKGRKENWGIGFVSGHKNTSWI